MAGSIPDSIRTIFIIRRAELQQQEDEVMPSEVHQRAEDPSEVLRRLIENGDLPGEDVPQDKQPDVRPPPKVLQKSLEPDESSSNWVNVEGQWVEVKKPEVHHSPSDQASRQADEQELTYGGLPQVIQRVIEVPYDKLREGDLRYNVVIRPGDIIRVPSPAGGNAYIGGRIARPGTYNIPGDHRLTFKQLVFAAGGFGPTAIPERVDLTRRIGINHEATIRFNARAIFEGNEPDFFIKPDDTINVGTNFPASPIVAARRGFRMTYGFGFLLDRNFGVDVYGPQNRGAN